MEMRDIKFPDPKRPTTKQRRLDKRVRDFAASKNTATSELVFSKPPRPQFSRAPFLAAALLMLLLLGIFGYRSFHTAQSFLRFRSLLGWQMKKESAPADQQSFSKLLTLLQGGASAVGGVKDISLSGTKLLGILDKLRMALPGFIQGKNTDVLPILQSAQGELDRFKTALDQLVIADPSLKDQLPFGSSYAALDAEIVRGKALLQGVIAWLQAPAAHHVIVFFANTSELRPGGGFMGSFADVTVQAGAIQDVTVHDINDVDGTRATQVVPPQPLQAITARWRAADANWFFDYPASAKKTLEFMAQSDLYATSTLDGMVTLTPAVVKDILTATGPVTLADGTVISADNFQDQIQKEVQAGQAAGVLAPKAILGELVPLLETELGSLSSDGQQQLALTAKRWIENKDLMIYMRDPALGQSMAAYQADGALYPLPTSFAGDYLAVTDANIGGGKTDRFIKQQVSLEADIDIDGILHDTVTVTRSHDAASAADWWYTLTNWNYLQIFTPNGVSVESSAGGGHRDIVPKADYHSGFATDPEVAAIEKTLVVSSDRDLQVSQESGRNVFGTWQKLKPGESKSFTLSYTRKLPAPPRDGDKLTFVFEAQSGAASGLAVKLAAPAGFVWADNNAAIYAYQNDAPPGRLVLNLILRKQD